MLNINNYLTKLQKTHWSPLTPRSYIRPDGGGLGKIATRDIGAFNLTWAIHRLNARSTHEQHSAAVVRFAQQELLNQEIVGPYPLGEWLVFLKPESLPMWFDVHSRDLSVSAYRNIKTALHALDRIQKV